ncbi:MAG: hypothetical protein ABH891_09675 [Candidatus Omnitrophota bacterium]
MNKLVRLVLLVLIILFCWGWVSNVALGRMTTGQYIRKIGADFQQRISNGLGKMRKTTDRITHNVNTLYGSVT